MNSISERWSLADPGMDKADLFREAMKVFVRVQAAKRLSALGGKVRQDEMIPRRGLHRARGSWRPYSRIRPCG